MATSAAPMFVGFSQSNHSFLAVPKSAIVSIRTHVSLECSVNSTMSVAWDFINVSLNEEKPVFFNGRLNAGPLESRYRINNERTGQYDLVIDSVDHEHAGRYICKPFHSAERTADITVIDSDPVCGMYVTNTTTDHIVWLWCEINSTGFLIPQMKWTKDNDVLINDTTHSTTINGLTTTTSFVRLQLQTQDNNAGERITVKCTTSFMWKNGSTESVPNYEHVWRHTFTLPYGVRNITIHSNASNFQIGDQLMCYADGNPEPSYTWSHLNTSRTQTGSVLTLNDPSLSIGSMHTFVCTAENTVAGERKIISETITLSIGATADSSPHHSEDWILAAGGGSVVIIVLIIVYVVYQCRKKKTKRNTSSTTSPPDTWSSDKTESTQRGTKGKGISETQRTDIGHGIELADAYESFVNRPTTSMQSDTYCELNLTEQEKSKTKSAILSDKRRGPQTQTIETYETLANRPSAAMQSETYCELNLLNQENPKSKSPASRVLEDENQEYQTIDDYETFANRPSPAAQSETYCELQIVKKKTRKPPSTKISQNERRPNMCSNEDKDCS